MPWLYEDPAELNYGSVDPAIRGLVVGINDSGWLLTEESCAGHPANEPSAWAGNRDLYLRLVVEKAENILLLLKLVDLVRGSYGGMKWSVSIAYDRSDELGTHWYMNFDYGKDVGNRHIAVDVVHRMLTEVNTLKNLDEG